MKPFGILSFLVANTSLLAVMWLVALLKTEKAKVIIAVQRGTSRGLTIPSRDQKAEAKHCCKAVPVLRAGPAAEAGHPGAAARGVSPTA